MFTKFDEEGSLRRNIPTSIVYTMATSAGSIFGISKYRDTCESSIPILGGIAILRYFLSNASLFDIYDTFDI